MLLWPDVPRRCFAPLPPDAFRDPERLVARVRWALTWEEGLPAFAGAYKEAAKAVFRRITEEPLSRNLSVLPLAFMWRHHIELALKDIILRGNRLHRKAATFPQHHRVRDLWNDAKPYVLETGDPLSPEVRHVEGTIKEIDSLDPDSFDFRYPTTKDGTRTLKKLPPDVDVRALHEALEAVANFLDGVANMQMVHEDALAQLARDDVASGD